jgi:hypothetical protein
VGLFSVATCATSSSSYCNCVASSGVLLVCRRRQTAWPLMVSVGNHLGSTRNSSAGKRIVAMIVLPEKLPIDTTAAGEEKYQFCCRYIVQDVWRKILSLIDEHKNGIQLVFPGSEDARVVVPRIGLVLGDMKEQWGITASHSWYSPRCGTLCSVRAGTGNFASNEAPVGRSSPEMDVTHGEADSDSESEAGWQLTVDLSGAECHDVDDQISGRAALDELALQAHNARRGGGAASVSDSDVDDDSSYCTSQCASSVHSLLSVMDVSVVPESIGSSGICDVPTSPEQRMDEWIAHGLGPCNRFRDPKARQKLLSSTVNAVGLPIEFNAGTLTEFKVAGYQPYVTCAFDDPEFTEIMGGISLYRRLPTDELHNVMTSFKLLVSWSDCLTFIGVSFCADARRPSEAVAGLSACSY